MAHPSEANLAPYAVRSTGPRGRTHPEPENPLRNSFEQDRHRILESTAFRRLEGKTQLFASAHHDHFRTRLTHTLEATQIARTLAGMLHANEALAEAITLAHDMGHPPFGHAGEAALNEAMTAHGGFNHNTHAVRVVDYLEHPFPAFRGLNLTDQTRAGLLAHVTRYDTPVSAAPSVEAQIASMADRIAYNCHDLEDAIGAGFVGLDDLKHVPIWQDAYEKIAPEYDVKHIHAVRRLVLDTILDGLLTDVIDTSLGLLAPIRSPQQVRQTTALLVAPSAGVDARLAELERFLIEHVYKHSDVAAMDAKGRQVVLTLFEAYRADPGALPGRFTARVAEQGLDCVICDYIAGMTDRLCTREHNRLLGGTIR